MGVPELIMFTVSVGLMFLSRLLYKAPKGDRNKRDDQPTNLATRGEWINYVLGTRKIGCLIAFAWNREVKQEKSAGGKGRPSMPGQDVYYESAWHLVAVGPVEALESILVNGESVWDTRITRDNTPSGTRLDLPNGSGSFSIYWGEIEQPINQELSQAIGITSQWPLHCYVIWHDYQLGNTARWPQIEYVITKYAQESNVPGNSYMGEAPEGGINPVMALAQILMADFPHGLGLSPDLIEGPTSETINYLRNEGLSMNLMVDPGSEAERVIQAICQDAGIFLAYESGRVRFMLQRDDVGGDPPELDDNSIVPPDIQRRILRGEKDLNRPVFTYKHRKNWEFRDFDVQIADDGEMSQAGSAAANRVDMPTVTDPNVANIVANRRVQENETEASVRVRALRSARRLIPGQCFIRNGQRYRITSVRWRDDSPGVELEAVLDTYGFAPSDASQNVTPPLPSIRPVEEDKAFAWMISPTNPNAIIVFRQRAHRQINGAFIYVSANSGSFLLIGSQNTAAAGGELEDAISSSSGEVLAQSPPFEDAAGDAANLPDLSGDAAAWQAGDLICKVNDEIMYAQSVSVLPEAPWLASTAYQEGDAIIPTQPTGYRYVCVQAGTSGGSEPSAWPQQQGQTLTDGDMVWEARHFRYRANNLIRNRRGTSRANHSSGSVLYLISATDLAPLAHPIIQGGNTLCVKSVPFTDASTADISAIDPVCGSLDPDVEGTILTTNDGKYLVTTTGDFLVTGE